MVIKGEIDMILVIDLGNSNIVMGIYRDDNLVHSFRTNTDLTKTEDEYASIIRHFLVINQIKEEEIENIIFASVVPPLRAIIILAINSLFNKMPILLGPGTKTGLMIKADNPNEVGADLIAGSVGVIKKYNYPAILIDLGTATKFIIVNDKGEFDGAVIAPGVRLSAEALANRAAQLPHIELVAPPKVIGKNTPDCMNSGAIYGAASMIDGMVRRIQKEMNQKCTLIATGGLAERIIPHCEEKIITDETLLLDGLYYIYKHHQKKVGERKNA
jgi:type III pantothenate kinase